MSDTLHRGGVEPRALAAPQLAELAEVDLLGIQFQ
jgi:hypothetical protein